MQSPDATLASRSAVAVSGTAGRRVLRAEGGEIEIVPVGERLVMRNLATGATVLSNAFGAAVLEEALAGGRFATLAAGIAEAEDDVPALAEAMAEMARGWTAAGLVGKAPVSVAPAMPREDTAEVTHRAVFGLGSQRFRLLSDSAQVFGEAALLMSEYRQADDGHPMPEIAVSHRGELALVRLDGRPVWREASADEARFLVMQTALAILAGRERVSAVLHAAMVVREGRALVLAGASGRGKSSLALGLVRRGWEFAGDDLVALADDGRSAIAMPFAAHVKEDDRVAEMADIGRRAYWTGRPGGVLYPARRAGSGGAFPVAAVVFPEFLPGAPFSSETVAPEEALEELLRTGTETMRPLNSIAPLAAMLGHARLMRWRHGATDEAFSAAETLVRQGALR